jgi:salicylate hydroxylase
LTRKFKVLIAGAGLGGLTAAACLLKRGHHVRVFEQAPQLGEVGAGIQLSANAVRVLHDLGLQESLAAVGVKPKAYQFRRFDTGELLHQVPLAESHERKHGTPYYHLHRVDLHAILAGKVRELDPECLQLGRRATGFNETGNEVVLSLQDEAVARGDILIGADGIKSVVRRQILGDTPATFTGQVAWRVTVPVEKLPQDIMDRVVNFVGCVERAWEEESWTQKRPKLELEADYAGWHPDIQTIIRAMDPEQCYRWAMNNREPVSHWSTTNTTLLGDAAHPTLPYMAQGAVMAIEDAAVLARSLGERDVANEALDLYQRNRLERTARVVRESTEHGEIFHIADADKMRRAFAEKNIAKSRDEWLYSYDPLTVPLV